jgi:Rod binding domain-containing protein
MSMIPNAPSAQMQGTLAAARRVMRERTLDPLVERQQTFEAALGQARDLRASAASPREAAEQLVAVAFVQPLLKMVRDANRSAPPFAPTPGEKMFGQISDVALSQGLVRASRFPLVDRLERDLQGRTTSAATDPFDTIDTQGTKP